MSESTLFGTTPDQDEAALIRAYQNAGRTLDDLPYTEQFETIYRRLATTQSRADVFHRLHNLRKAGRLPRLGRGGGERPHIDPEQERVLADLVQRAVGKLSLRDQLPYTQKFDAVVSDFNAIAGLRLQPHDVWRIVAKLAK
jgi:hypothetical protein